MKKPILITGKQCSGKSQLVKTIQNFCPIEFSQFQLSNSNLFEIYDDIFKNQYDNYVFEEIVNFKQIIDLERFFINNSLERLKRIYVIQTNLIPEKVNIKYNQKLDEYFNWIPLYRYQDIFQQTNKQKLVQEIDAFLGLHSTKINHGFPYMLPKYFFQFRIEKKEPKILLEYNAGNKTANDFLKKHWFRNETF
ncbi:hypothetical protein [Empedobacter falsenii]|uniref:hypothetical protein n=1 Tax=Empedobacter falsenii TaxID=343874 RepID=UPI001C8D0D3F|nr:hypothetical protein [Empedobacter falsenii]MBY0067559.1 hypothetical protein [Empedobacter falsenii]